MCVYSTLYDAAVHYSISYAIDPWVQSRFFSFCESRGFNLAVVAAPSAPDSPGPLPMASSSSSTAVVAAVAGVESDDVSPPPPSNSPLLGSAAAAAAAAAADADAATPAAGTDTAATAAAKAKLPGLELLTDPLLQASPAPAPASAAAAGKCCGDGAASPYHALPDVLTKTSRPLPAGSGGSGSNGGDSDDGAAAAAVDGAAAAADVAEAATTTPTTAAALSLTDDDGEKEEEEEEISPPPSPDRATTASPATTPSQHPNPAARQKRRSDYARPTTSSPFNPADVTMIPGEAEQTEICIPGCIVSSYSLRAIGDVFLTNFRLVIMCESRKRVPRSRRTSTSATPMGSRQGSRNSSPSPASRAGSETLVFEDDGGGGGGGGEEEEEEEDDDDLFDVGRMKLGSKVDLSTQVPIGMVMEVTLREPQRGSVISHRASEDCSGGPDSSRPHSRSGRASRPSSTTSLMPGMRSKKGLAQLVVRCRDFRTLVLTFTDKENVHGSIQALHDRLSHLIHNVTFQPPAFTLGATNEEDWEMYSPSSDYLRQGVTPEGILPPGIKISQWRQCKLNKGYQICPTYPSVWYVPRCLDDGTVKESAAFRSKGRLPILTYYHKKRGSAIVRCAQPLIGATGRRSESDENLVNAVRLSSPHPDLLVIFDARSKLAEMGNQLMGKGAEDTRNYEKTKVLFMEIQNIHAVRASTDALQALCEGQSDSKWLSKLEDTGWLQHVQSILSASSSLARKVEQQTLSCIVHCSDGWDRTAQLSSLAQIMLDPYYRTIDGFRALVDKEWLSFGHMFGERSYCPEGVVERSAIFLLFLDCTWQIMSQFPAAFEFTESFLIMLADHYQSAWFGNFLMDCERHRLHAALAHRTTSIWSHVRAVRNTFLNKDYVEVDHVIYPGYSAKQLQFWKGYFLRHEQAALDSKDRNNASADDEFEEHNTVVWVPDADVKSCNDCGLKFTVVRRRHHCRACGHVFCRDCSQDKCPLPSFGYKGDQRVCDSCYTKYRPAKVPLWEP